MIQKKTDDRAVPEQKQNELEKLNKKLDTFIEMRSDGEISKEIFKAKCSEIEPKLESLRKEIEELSVQAEEPVIENYAEKLTVLQYALEQYTNWDDKDVPESVIEAFVEKIVASENGFDWYFRFGDDPNDPIHCNVTGKRKSTTKISVAGVNSPAVHSSDKAAIKEKQK